MEQTFDYVIVGAGSAGCVLANRLSENPGVTVALLEAGPPDRSPYIHIPAGLLKLPYHTKINWRYNSATQSTMKGRQIFVPRGKTLGGTSSINGMVYIRGHHRDYDEWRQRGCVGWDWDSVLPFFRKAEDQARGADEFHGVGGPLHVSDQPSKFELAEAALQLSLIHI